MKRTKGSNEEILHNPKRKFRNRCDSGSLEDDPSQSKTPLTSRNSHPGTLIESSESCEGPEAVMSTDQTETNDETDGNITRNELSGNRVAVNPVILDEESGKDNDGSEIRSVENCDNEKENFQSSMDTDEECSKDNESRCSESDPGDKSYRINVGLYGTDFDEDSTRDEGESFIVPPNKYPDLNNNQPVCSMTSHQLTSFGQIEPSKQVSIVAGMQDERSNTVDGSTRRALESQCIIYETENSRTDQAPATQPILNKELQGRYGQEKISTVSVGYREKEHDPPFSKSIAEALREALAEDTPKRTTPTVIGQSYGSCYQHAQNDQFNKVTTQNVKSTCFPVASRSSLMTLRNDQYNKVSSSNLLVPRFSEASKSRTMTLQSDHYCKVSTPNLLSPRFGVAPRSSVMTSQLNVDENMAAEQIATELVQTYSGKNSHMITDILERKTGSQYNLTAADQRQYEDLAATQTVLHDVDLLNTPQQLTPVDQESPSNQCYIQGNDYQDNNYPHSNSLSTPESFRHNESAVCATQFQGKMMYNDIQVYGSKWSAKVRPQGTQGYMESCSENPYPRQLHYSVNESPSAYINRFPMQEGTDPSSTPSRAKVPTTYDYRQFNLDTHLHKLQSPPPVYSKGHSNYRMECAYPLSPDPLGLVGMVGTCPRPSHEVTQMTYTPKEMMESHLSSNNPVHRNTKTVPQSTIPRAEFSSIYPPKEYIDHPFTMTSENADTIHTVRPKPLKKRYRPSKYDQLPFRGPTMLPADDMISKYPLPREAQAHGARHKYIVNPSNVKEISPKTLITKYIDFLIVENEQITDISQSPGAPEDIYVTEDMDFMDSLKRKGQFPSKKFREWVRNFYPRLDFDTIKFKGQSPVTDSNTTEAQLDPRPTQQILEDTFYFFQRTLMNFKETNIP